MRYEIIDQIHIPAPKTSFPTPRTEAEIFARGADEYEGEGMTAPDLKLPTESELGAPIERLKPGYAESYFQCFGRNFRNEEEVLI